MGEGPHYNDMDFDMDWLNDFDVSVSKSQPSASEQPEKPSHPRAERIPASDQPRSRQSYSAQDQLRSRQSYSAQDQLRSRQSYPAQDQPRCRQSRPAQKQPRSRQSYPAQDQPRSRQSRPVQEARPTRQSRPARSQGTDRRATPVMSDYEQARQGRGRASRPPRRQKANTPLTVIAIVLAAGMLFAGWQLVSILLDYHRDSSAYNDLADEATAMLAEQDEVAAPEATASADVQAGEHVSEVPISVDWDYLQSINEEIIGWLYCPDTVINYPVMQTSDNSYYLYRNYKNESAGAGALFADTDSVAGITHSNLIVYGHNMKNDSMFGTLEEYKDQDYYDEHPTLYFLTPSANYRIDLIAAHLVESTLDNFPTYFEDESEYQEYLTYITSHSFFTTDATVSTEYQLFTMSTCDYTSSYSDPRLLVQGMMVPIT